MINHENIVRKEPRKSIQLPGQGDTTTMVQESLPNDFPAIIDFPGVYSNVTLIRFLCAK